MKEHGNGGSPESVNNVFGEDYWNDLAKGDPTPALRGPITHADLITEPVLSHESTETRRPEMELQGTEGIRGLPDLGDIPSIIYAQRFKWSGDRAVGFAEHERNGE